MFFHKEPKYSVVDSEMCRNLQNAYRTKAIRKTKEEEWLKSCGIEISLSNTLVSKRKFHEQNMTGLKGDSRALMKVCNHNSNIADDLRDLQSSQSKKHFKEENIMIKLLKKSGFELSFNSNPNFLMVDQTLFQKNLDENLKNHVDFSKVLEEFIQRFDQFIGDSEKYVSPHNNSYRKMMKMIY
ncbi:Fanconi anemia group D2 [Nymphon striatum]|nr:Fanconi anemia group D2 [Nymphon striatum]